MQLGIQVTCKTVAREVLSEGQAGLTGQVKRRNGKVQNRVLEGGWRLKAENK